MDAGLKRDVPSFDDSGVANFLLSKTLLLHDKRRESQAFVKRAEGNVMTTLRTLGRRRLYRARGCRAGRLRRNGAAVPGGGVLHRRPLKEFDEEGGGGEEEYGGDGYARDNVGGGVFARSAALVGGTGEQSAADEPSRACDEGQRAPFADGCRQKRKDERRGKTNERGDAEALRRTLIRKAHRAHIVVRDKFVERHSEKIRDPFQSVDGGQPAVILPFGDRRTRHIKFLRELVLGDPVLSSETFEFFSECHSFLPDATSCLLASFRFDIILRPLRTFVTTLSVTSAFFARTFYVACNFETNGDGAKLSDEGHVWPLIGHLRTHTPPQAGTPALPRPHWFQCVPVLRIVVSA